MRSHRHHLFQAAAMLLAAACAEDASTGVDFGGPGASPDMVVAVPTGVRERSVVRTVSTVSDGVGPARTEDQGYGSYPSSEPIVAYSSIWGAKTVANFLPGQLSVIGSHYYSGNKGSVDTSGKVSYEGVQVGTQRSMAENTFPFLFDLGREHFIWTEARIYTDRTCGLDGYGDSAHRAWWEAVMGGPVFSFHSSVVSSISDRERQPDCASVPPPPPPPGTGSTSAGGGAATTCYIWIVYDIYSGEIYDQDLLYCTDDGG